MRFIQTIQAKFSSVELLEPRGRVSSFSIDRDDLKPAITFLLEGGFRFITMAGEDERSAKNRFTISYIFGFPKENRFVSLVLSVDPSNPVFPSVADVLLSARLFGLEIMDMFGLTPEGHPDIELSAQENGKERRLVRHHNWPKGEYPLRKDFLWNKRPREANVEFPFLAYSREEGVFEIPVGPIHAGVIEPGHFRFTAVGEMILNLEIRLWYSHRGIEKLFEQKNLTDAVVLAEHISGDTSFAHSLAFCEAAEELAGMPVSKRAGLLRIIFLELERIYNHVGDIGMIGLDAAFAFAGSNGSRLKELAMQLNDKLTGSRILRGVNAIGGVTKDITGENAEFLEKFLASFEQDFEEFVNVLFSTSSLLDRLETTGRLKQKTAFDYNTVGVVARASGLKRDARQDFPNEWWRHTHMSVPTFETGDVFARFQVRV